MAITSKGKRFNSILLSSEVDQIEEDMLRGLSEDELEVIYKMMENEHLSNYMDTIDLDREMLPIEKWIDDPYYSGIYAETMYDPLKQDMCDIINGNYSEVIETGALGVGKTTIGRALIVRMVYELSCFRSPQMYYGLMPHTLMSFVNLGNNLNQIEKVVYSDYKPELSSIQYFSEQCRILRDSAKIGFVFEKNICIRPGISGEGGFIGEAVFGGLIDEINFRKKEKNARQKNGTDEMSETDKLVDALKRRIESRMQKGDYNPGRIIISSSKRSEYDFTEKRAIKMKNDPKVFIRDRAKWHVKNKAHYSGELFYVLVGGKGTPSEVLSNERYEELKDNIPDGCIIVDIPVEEKGAFTGGRDLDQAIRDVAGISTVGFDKFIKNKEIIDKIFKEGLPEYITLEGGKSANGCITYGSPIELHKKLFHLNEEGVPIKIKRHSYAPRHAHIDIGLTGDRLGLSIGHVVDYIKIRLDPTDEDSVYEEMPRIELDVAIGFTPPENDEIRINKIRGLIYKLKKWGMPITKITMDSYQCLSKNTELFVLGYGIMTLCEVIEKFGRDKFLVMAYDERKNKMVWATAKNARVTHAKPRKKLRVWFNNNRTYEDVSGDHPFKLQDGEYVIARELKPGMMLYSPFKRKRWSHLKRKDIDCYMLTDISKKIDLPMTDTMIKLYYKVQKDANFADSHFCGILEETPDSYSIFFNHLQTMPSFLQGKLDRFSMSLMKRIMHKAMLIRKFESSDLIGKVGFDGSDKSMRFIEMIIGDIARMEVMFACPDSKVFADTWESLFGKIVQPTEIKDLELDYNFMVSKIETVYLEEDEDWLGDIEVPHYKNFLLASGIIVHNSRDSLQIFKDKGYEAELLQTGWNEYHKLKDTLNQERLKAPPNLLLENELVELEKDEATMKIDHPPDSTNDLSDAVCGVVKSLSDDRPDSISEIYTDNTVYTPSTDDDDEMWHVRVKPMEKKRSAPVNTNPVERIEF